MMSPYCGVIVVLVVAGLPPAWADDKAAPERPLKLALAAKAKAVKPGEKPVFVLTVENRGAQPERLWNGHRTHLQATWYQLLVTQDGKPVEVMHLLIGVPLMEDGDLVTLKPGETVEFELTTFVPVVESLPPGKYAGRFRFGTFPEKGKGTSYESPPAEFVIEK
jgi:hypothetical protein